MLCKLLLTKIAGPSQGGDPPPCLAEQLTLSQPGGQIMPTTVLQAPSIFQTLRRPCVLKEIILISMGSAV